LKKHPSGPKEPDREIAEFHKEQSSGLPPAKLAAKESRARHLREIRKLRRATEEQALNGFRKSSLFFCPFLWREAGEMGLQKIHHCCSARLAASSRSLVGFTLPCLLAGTF